MPRVHVRLALGAVAIEFAGENQFFEAHVEPLVVAQAQGPGGVMSSPDPVAVPAFPPLVAPTLAERVAPQLPTFQPAAPQNFNAFVRQVGERAQAPEQRLMAFVFYLWNYEKREQFSKGDIEAFFRTVRDEGLEQVSELLSDLWERRRFLEPGDSDGLWRLTPKGLNYVKNRLLTSA